MTTNRSTHPSAEINMTPLIDVLLVLLIIFMVITPLKPQGFDARVPVPTPASAPAVSENEIVLTIHRDASIQLNQQNTTSAELPDRLSAIFKYRSNRSCFLKAHPDLEYKVVAQTIDILKGAGASELGLLTQRK